MKKVLLLGDSIRQGYQSTVKDAFDGILEIYAPNDNCRFAENMLRHIHNWCEGLGILDGVDVVHWNVGLWDTLILFEEECLTPLNVYEDFIRRICKRIIVLFPDAKVIFATSTPVWEEKFTCPKKAMRYNKDTEKYNEAAVKIVREFGFEVNDLYKVMNDAPLSYHSDMTHYATPEGTKLISSRVIEYISKATGEKPKSNFNIKLNGDVIGC